MVSPRTRNLPRTRFMSLRSYCMSTSRRRMARWSCSSPRLQVQDPLGVLLGRSQAVDAADTEATTMTSRRVSRADGGRVAEPVDLVVDRAVLLDVGVARREVGLGLVVVVVADEVLDPVVGEELADLVGQLGGQGLVGGDDQRRALDLLDRPGDGGALAAAGDAEQGLEAVAPLARPRTAAAIAFGWSPAGSKSESTSNGGMVRCYRGGVTTPAVGPGPAVCPRGLIAGGASACRGPRGCDGEVGRFHCTRGWWPRDRSACSGFVGFGSGGPAGRRPLRQRRASGRTGERAGGRAR